MLGILFLIPSYENCHVSINSTTCLSMFAIEIAKGHTKAAVHKNKIAAFHTYNVIIPAVEKATYSRIPIILSRGLIWGYIISAEQLEKIISYDISRP